jgi:hypothetical protein
MKTSKKTSESGKRNSAEDRVKNKKNIGNDFHPTEDEIREKANEIYLQRIDRGEHGTAEDDWIEAEKLLSVQYSYQI